MPIMLFHKHLLFLPVLLLFQLLYGQDVILDKNIDFGIISDNSPGIIDISIKNISQKDVFIFRLDADDRYLVNFSSKKLNPDSTSFIRLLFRPEKKGLFHEKLALHLSCYENPIYISTKGFVNEIPTKNISCPSFVEQNPKTNTLNFQLKITVVDKRTNKIIPEASIVMIRDGIIIQDLKTNKNGEKQMKTPLGLYYFICTKKSYQTLERVEYVNRNNNELIFKLTNLDSVNINESSVTNELVIIEDSTLFDDQEVELILETPKDDSIVNFKNDIADTDSSFSLRNYAPNNIVFLLDLSTSMRYTGKLDLLKASMYELNSILREVDHVTMIGYASRATIILETTTANNKDTINKIIKNLSAKGLTDGGTGMKLAYNKVCNAFIEDGNNEIIIATDGDFNKGDENVHRLAKKYNRKGIKVSVIGIKSKSIAETSMRALAKNGGGNFIPINSYKNALNSLVNEIKTNSLIGFKK